jgi:hypothetical protein
MSQVRELNTQDEDEEASEGEGEGLLGGIEPAELIATARQRVVGVVTEHPVLSLVGAFAVGFALARIVKALGDD